MRLSFDFLGKRGSGWCSYSLLAALLVVTATASFGYSPQGQSSSIPLQKDKQAKDQDKEQETLKIDVNVANIFFNVKDKHGALVAGLKKEDFEVMEDAEKQTIKYFSAESNLPLTLGILIDTSGSMDRVLPMEKEVGGEFLKEVIRPKDLAFVMNFDVNVELQQDFTASARELKNALGKLRINTGGGAGGGIPGIGQGPIPISHPRGTALFDAVYLAGREKLAGEVGRKAMIILTDGEDFGSRVKLQEAIEAAQKSDSICYVLLIVDRGFYSGGGYGGDRDMKKLAEETGGRVIEVGNNYEKLKAAFDQISAELRSQYSVGYTPTNSKRDGGYRKVEIRTSTGRVQARKGYYASRK